MAKKLRAVIASPPLKLNLGCGKVKMEGFTGVDRRKFEGVDVVHDLMSPWPWKDDSVEEVHASHIIEHFTGKQRVWIMNEMCRVMVKGGKAAVITPYWCSNRAYGDFTHQWPPVSEMFFYYLNREWRKANAPDNDIEFNPEGYTCDFDWTYGYGVHPQIAQKNQEAQMFCLTFYKEAAQDLVANLVKR